MVHKDKRVISYLTNWVEVSGVEKTQSEEHLRNRYEVAQTLRQIGFIYKLGDESQALCERIVVDFHFAMIIMTDERAKRNQAEENV